MKTPAEYLNVPVLYLTYPTGEEAEQVPVVTYDDALHAVESALADAEKYKYLLMRALRRSMPEGVSEAEIRPFYSGMAA
ncbi:hypothetical protein [Hymenobacter koreensis]|uniref:Uncharacterized protein n=1 Tax=Hymenobacter koreensis TaxID=1084523 RepID=A0ABP8IV36_9BACT